MYLYNVHVYICTNLRESDKGTRLDPAGKVVDHFKAGSGLKGEQDVFDIGKGHGVSLNPPVREEGNQVRDQED